MVKARLRMLFPLPANIKKCSLPFAVHKLAGHESRECYVQSLVEQKMIDCSLASKSTVKEYWNHLPTCITEFAGGIIIREVCSSPEWLEESADVLKPLVEEKNQKRCKFVPDPINNI